MKIIRSIGEVPHPPGSIGFVPTMGAFHEGHLHLMRTARQQNETLAVSLFVNPLQFGPKEDLAKYPRDFDRDSALAEAEGVDVLFAPSVEEMYAAGLAATVSIPALSNIWEGAIRPGHFDGVATVVTKLFHIVRPTTAYFGLKDLQQCMVLQAMVESLNFPVTLEFEPTIREADGLAMSSRNVYLETFQRRAAPTIYQELVRCGKAIRLRNTSVDAEIEQSKSALHQAGGLVDYFDFVALPSMRRLRNYAESTALICAVRFGSTRLIDNLLL